MIEYMLKNSGDCGVNINNEIINIRIDFISEFGQYFKNINKKEFSESSVITIRDLCEPEIFKQWIIII